MSKLKQSLKIVILALFAIAFVQAAGGYLVFRLSLLDENAQTDYPEVEEKIVRQMILQLEPREYYTIQIDSFLDATQGQEKIDNLARQGYRVFVTDGPPYQLLIGCIGREPLLDTLPEVFLENKDTMFVQKLILNKIQFQFPVSADTNQPDSKTVELQHAATLISSYDVMLKHSLLLFQDYCYENCSEENWNAMIAQIQDEVDLLRGSVSDLLSFAESEQLVGSLLNLLAVTESYDESLQLIVEKKNTQVVLLAQSYLLELIEYYHHFIESHRVLNAVQ